MDPNDLTTQRCIPCEGGVPKLTRGQIRERLTKVKGWTVKKEKLHKRFELDGFLGAMAFIQKLAELAEAEGHHPDFCVHYNIVDVTLYTHVIDGLSDNDFILAAKIDAL
jgi:4a-hydroxytetrahydrobiopterin dehydratase